MKEWGKSQEKVDKAISVLKDHKAHWERLKKEHIAEKEEAKNFIEAVDQAIFALEFQQKVLDRKTEIYYKEGITAEENAEYYALMRLLGVEF